MKRFFLLACLLGSTLLHASGPKTPPPPLSFIPFHAAIKFNPEGNANVIKSIHPRGLIIELTDGSLWELENMGPEALAFHVQKKFPLAFEFCEDQVKCWRAGDKVVFFQLTPENEHLLIYNTRAKQLFEVMPFAPPTQPLLTVAAYTDHDVTLSDGSKWLCSTFAPEYEWEVGDPITIIKNNPWKKSVEPYILVNLCACRCDATVRHIHPNRQPVRKAE